MAHATLHMNGKTFVLVPEREFRRLTLVAAERPVFPDADAAGNFPAAQTGRVLIAREIIQRREAAGLSQNALAASAGIRVEMLSRIEKAKVTADTAIIMKIERALKHAEKQG